MIDKYNCAFSVVYSLLKVKSKGYKFENIFTIFKWQNKTCWQKVLYNDFAIHVGNHVGICQMST